jgi:hypothetical protein
MGFTTMETKRPFLLTGKTGTGKSFKARELLPNAPIFFADEMGIKDLGSMSKDDGIIIEDIHIKPKKDEILNVLRRYRGQVIITSINEKSVPKDIKAMCQIKRAGSNQYLLENIMEMAPRSLEPLSIEQDTYSLVSMYLRETDRDLIAKILKHNKPADTQILSWLVENLHPNKILFVDGVVKRRWSQNYFYEMLAYAHAGKQFGQVKMPKRGKYSQKPKLIKRVGIKTGEERLLRQYLKDEEFVEYAKTKLNNGECRILGLGEKRRRKKTDPVKVQQKTLGDYL